MSMRGVTGVQLSLMVQRLGAYGCRILSNTRLSNDYSHNDCDVLPATSNGASCFIAVAHATISTGVNSPPSVGTCLFRMLIAAL
jgi:hypothetical protein